MAMVSLADEQRRDAACDGKVAYSSLSAALAALAIIKREGALHYTSNFGPYRCRFCKEWHLGH